MLRRPLAAVLVAAVIGTVVATPAAAWPDLAPRAHHRTHARTICPQPYPHGAYARERLIRCLAVHRHALGGPSYVLSIARCESGSDFQAGIDRYAGTFQHLASAWVGRVLEFMRQMKTRLFHRWHGWRYGGRTYNVVPPTNVRANSEVAIWLAKGDGSWSQEWSCA